MWGCLPQCDHEVPSDVGVVSSVSHLFRKQWPEFLKQTWGLRRCMARWKGHGTLWTVADNERRTREAAVEADTILNHMLKNIMAAVRLA